MENKKSSSPIHLVLIAEAVIWLLVIALFTIHINTLHFPVYNLFTTLLLLALGFFYMIGGALLFVKGPVKNIFEKGFGPGQGLQIGAGIPYGFFCAVFAIGLWASILRLPIARLQLFAAAGSLGLFSLFLLVMLFIKPSRFPITGLLRSLVFTSVAIILLQAPVNWVVRLKYKDYPEFIRAQDEYYRHPEDSAAFQKYRQELQKIYPGGEPLKHTK